MRKHNVMLIGLCLCLVRSPCAWANYLSNGSFETGHPGGWTNAVGWYSTEEWGGELIADADAFHGTNSIKINAFGTSSHILNQRWPLTGGQVYEVSGYMRTSTTNAFNPTNGYCTIVVQFYDRTGNKVARNCDTLHFVGNGPTSWTRYSTGPLLAPANAVTGRTILFYYRGVPPDETTNGEVFVDYVVATDSSPSQAGAVLNPDFEVQPVGNALTNIPYWTAFGNAGAVVEKQAHTGRFALMLWWTETLLGQSWDATSGMRYGTSAWVMTPTNDPMTGTNSHAVVLLQYLNSTGGVIVTYESDWVGPTNVSGGTWSNLVAEGIAPTGTVSGRTMLAILGQDDSFGGVVYFDDVSQYTLGGGTTTVCGVLENSGFEDGIKGNAYDLDASGQLPAWEWLGGTNAGFITDALDLGGWQSLAITYPENLAAQVFAPATGMQYVLSGYIYNPSTTAEVLRGEAYGTFVLEFWNGTDLVSSVTTEHFDTNSAHDTWVFFAVTNRAPWGDPGQGLTGRVLSAILGSGTNYGGVLYFDQLCLTGSAAVVTNLQSGALWNPGFEYTARGTVLKYVDDWEALGLAGVVDGEVRRSGEHSLEIYYPETLAAQYWEAQPGYKYESAAWVYTPDGEGRLEGVSNLHAVVLLQYLDSTGGVLYTYESGWFTTNDAAGVWTQLVVRGVAPVGTVTGRTLVGLLGTNTGFGGAVYFDDAGQALVSTGGSVSGLLRNPGYDDGVPGNAYDLDASSQLPAWKWYGGTNAGFISREHCKDGEQALVVTWPQNTMAQDWPAASGVTYVASGYLFTPSDKKFNSDGSSYGRLEMVFYVGGDTNPAQDYIYYSARFTWQKPADQWIYFSVTGMAPPEAVVTGRLNCTIYSDDPGGDMDLAGVIYFDQLSVIQQGGMSDWEQWQMQNFGSTNAPGTGPVEDYDGDGYLNWSEFIAGTQPTNEGSYLSASSEQQQSSKTSLVIKWDSTSGRYYAVLRSSTGPGPGNMSMVASNIVATPPENVYIDDVGNAWQVYYYRIQVRTNQW